MSSSPDTFGPFARLAEAGIAVKQISYYDGPFADWHDSFSFDQEWDIPLTSRVLQDMGARRILDIGCGTGRLAAKLVQQLDTYVGIDTSLRALELFDERATPEIRKISTVRHLDLRDLADANLPAVDAAVLGSVTINSFPTRQAVETLLRNVLGGPGSNVFLLLGVFTPESVARFASYYNVVDVSVYDRGEATRSIVWRGMHYVASAGLLLHNLFLEEPPGSAAGYLGVTVEHPWSVTEIREIAEAEGFAVEAMGSMAVDTGGAEGWDVELLAIGSALPDAQS